MTDEIRFEELTRSWLDEGPTAAPWRAVEGALLEIDQTTQERDLRVPWRFRTLAKSSQLAAAAVLAVVAVGAVFVILRPGSTGGPAATASPSPSISPSPTAAPSEGPTLDGTSCGLLTKPEVLAASGHSYPAPVPHGSGVETACTFEREGGDIFLRLTYTTTGGGAAFDLAKAAPDIVVIADMGDEAFYDPAIQTLFVRVGDSMAKIRVFEIIGSTYSLLDFAKDIGGLVAPRL